MGEEVSPEVIKKTQEYLKKFIKRPPLTEKLLKKPPFRFLHDIITNVINETGFLRGLYDNNEMQSENIKDRDSKIAFLQKLIDTLKIVTEEKIAARPSKIIAGLEPTKTNQLLQVLGLALEKKLDSSPAIEKITGNAPMSDKKKSKRSDDNKTTKLVRKNTEERLSFKKKASPRVGKDKDSTKKSSRPDEKKNQKELSQKPECKEKNEAQEMNIINENQVKETTEPQSLEPKLSPKLEISEKPKVKPESPKKSLKEKQNIDSKSEVIETQATSEQNFSPKAHKTKDIPLSMKTITEKPKPVKTDDKNEPIELRSSAATTSVPVRAPSRQLLRPPSVRPASARPAAPRLRERGKSAMQNELDIENANNLNSAVKVIIDHVNEVAQDDEETVQVEEDVLEPSIPQIGKLPAEQGHLVKQILDQIGQTNDETPQMTSLTSTDHIQDEDWQKITLSIQTLTRAANPLGKLVGYVHEDVDGMISELKNWRQQNEMLAKAVSAEMTKIKENAKPLIQQIEKLDTEIERQRNMIHSAQANVMRNQTKIVQLLSRE